jgi:hypothetical protein
MVRLIEKAWTRGVDTDSAATNDLREVLKTSRNRGADACIHPKWMRVDAQIRTGTVFP